MDIGKFFHKLWNPHCTHCAMEAQVKREQELEDRVCNSCEILRIQLEKTMMENHRLIEKLTEKPAPPPIIQPTEAPKPIFPRAIPWKVRQQMLEQEDRVAAKLKKDAPKPDAPVTSDAEIKEFEKELDNAAQAREEKSS